MSSTDSFYWYCSNVVILVGIVKTDVPTLRETWETDSKWQRSNISLLVNNMFIKMTKLPEMFLKP